MKKIATTAFACLAVAFPAIAADGDTFIFNGLNYTVLSEADKTCEVAPTPDAEGNVVVPETANGYTVTALGERAFYIADNLTALTLPSTLTKIGREAVSRVYITDIVIPNSVTEIAGRAFYACYNLANVTLSTGISTIERETFSGNIGLKHITIPDNVTTIADEAFNYSALSSIDMGHGVQTLGVMAFAGCGSLSEVTISSSVTRIAREAFSYCPALATVTLEETSRNLTFEKDVFGTLDYADSQAPLTTLNIGRPFSCTEADANVQPFIMGKKLTTITFGPDVTAIPDAAFNGTAIRQLEIPAHIKTIGHNAFGSCDKLLRISAAGWEAPAAYDDSFSSATFSGAIVSVPFIALNFYKNNAVWGKFTRFNGLSTDMPFDVTLSATQLELTEGQTASLSYTFDPAEINTEAIAAEWLTSDDTVATIDADGNVTPKGNGETEITLRAAVKGTDAVHEATCTVTVTGFANNDNNAIETITAGTATRDDLLYDLQGRPATPRSHGLLIRRSADGSSRIIIRKFLKIIL